MNRPKPVKFTAPKRLADYPVGPTFRSAHLIETNEGMRTFRPVFDYDKCVNCLQCFLLCPDGAVDKSALESGGRVEVDYNYCKGCGVCAHECKPGAIRMIKEGEQ